ncbi:MAG: hypothetical protein A3J06_00385 [Candidatus Moranbacteria bacterium RIFCSPLOWO2_02_FULL_48_19]|nr:MAG: hypothetical protein A3J06_00385 [Candidatus Moranbacteria bacterium RIFCSPLOWO2_02_FULL_48_19]OGI30764.1 MAG: hypothetical protein A3G09_01785 [Candidatus Moranbacteria bacterium RIFCSPLOWO2_12_FULL_48_12]
MAFSWFSRKQPADKEAKEELSNLLGIVRTMKDDLEDVRNGRQGTSPDQAEKQEDKNNLSQKTVNPFSEEGEKVLQARDKAGGGRAGNPFGVISRPSNTPSPNDSQSQPLKYSLSGLTPEGGEVLTDRPGKNHQALWMWIIVALMFVIIAGGVFYFFSQRNQMETEDPSLLPDTTSIPKNAEEPATQDLPYALDKPNYISFNTETVSLEDIRKTLSQAALRMKAGNIVQPIEFLVTDQNNNPLAFNRFAFLLTLDLAPDVAALANENFSLYMYNDDGRARLGLALTFRDAPAAVLALAKTETALPYAFQNLILEPNISVSKITPFRSSAYNQVAVRFANVSADQNVSFDYALAGNQWFIGTSKNTLRAILDINKK